MLQADVCLRLLKVAGVLTAELDQLLTLDDRPWVMCTY